CARVRGAAAGFLDFW
nr:immunoglobulin heavy chain junction region [Macaca mulatta]